LDERLLNLFSYLIKIYLKYSNPFSKYQILNSPKERTPISFEAIIKQTKKWAKLN
jgi:hypothetical protein